MRSTFQINDVKIALFKCHFLNYKEKLYNKWNYDSESFDNVIKGVFQSVVNEYGGGTVVKINRTDDCIVIAVVTDSIISGLEKKFEDCFVSIIGIDCSTTKSNFSVASEFDLIRFIFRDVLNKKLE